MATGVGPSSAWRYSTSETHMNYNIGNTHYIIALDCDVDECQFFFKKDAHPSFSTLDPEKADRFPSLREAVYAIARHSWDEYDYPFVLRNEAPNAYDEPDQIGYREVSD